MKRLFALVIGTFVLGAVVGSTGARADTVAANEVLAEGERFDVVRTSSGTLLYRYHESLREVAEAEARADGHRTLYERDPLIGSKIARDGVTGCRYSDEFQSTQSPREGLVYVQRQVEVRPKDCVMLVEGAWLTPETVADSQLVPDANRESDESATVLDSPTAPQGVAGLAYEWDGHIKGYTEDPVQVDLATTTSRVQWNWTSDCYTSALLTSRWEWFSGSRWTDVERTSNPSSASDCTPSLGTYGLYRNGVFCATIDTFIEHDVFFEATGNGASRARWDLDAYGGCSFLLSSSHVYDPR